MKNKKLGIICFFFLLILFSTVGFAKEQDPCENLIKYRESELLSDYDKIEKDYKEHYDKLKSDLAFFKTLQKDFENNVDTLDRTPNNTKINSPKKRYLIEKM